MISSASRPVSIIVPAYREAPNIPILVERTFATMNAAGLDSEMIIVDDDSRDGTAEVVQSLARHHPVRLLVRTDERGLSSAVLAGFQMAKFERFVVLDADLQHPPEAIPELVRKLDDPNCDFVVASRYVAAGKVADTWPVHRRLASKLATLLARPLTSVSDPMSGFFALRRSTWDAADRLNPIGYKIALELFVKCRCRHPSEVPIQFATRVAGTSKAGFAEGMRYLRHLVSLYWFRRRRLVVAAAAIIATCVIGLVFR